MKRFIRYFVVISLLALISACGGSKHHRESISPIGVWENTSNILLSDNINTCVDVLEGNTTFQDYQTINQIDEDTYELTSDIGMINGYGSLDEDNNITFTENYEGDIFGDGSYCTYLTHIKYIQNDNGTFRTIYDRSLECNDGFSCEDKVLGLSSPANM